MAKKKIVFGAFLLLIAGLSWGCQKAESSSSTSENTSSSEEFSSQSSISETTDSSAIPSSESSSEPITTSEPDTSSNDVSSEASSEQAPSTDPSSEPSTPNPSSSQTDSVTYHVQFVNCDDSLLYETDVEEGSDAVYVGDEPTKEEDDEFTYTFSGWDPEPTNVHQDLVCKAQFDSEGKEPWSSIEWF